MKKFFLILLTINLIFMFSACTVRDNNDDLIDDDDNIIGDETIPEATPNDTINNGTNGNGMTNGNGNGMTNGNGATNNNDDNYITSLGRIDEELRTSLGDLDNEDYDANDPDYLTNMRGGYNKRATAYRRALDELDALNYRGNNTDYHNAVRGYYQGGYDLYNNLYSQYGNFTTIDDESAYRNEVGDEGFRINRDIETTYNDALRSLRINGTNNGNNGNGYTGNNGSLGND